MPTTFPLPVKVPISFLLLWNTVPAIAVDCHRSVTCCLPVPLSYPCIGSWNRLENQSQSHWPSSAPRLHVGELACYWRRSRCKGWVSFLLYLGVEQKCFCSILGAKPKLLYGETWFVFSLGTDSAD